MDVCCRLMNKPFEYRSSGGETLLNNRLLRKGITFVKMYDTEDENRPI